MAAPREVIDLFFYELYGLTDKEIRIVEEATKSALCLYAMELPSLFPLQLRVRNKVCPPLPDLTLLIR